LSNFNLKTVYCSF